MKRYELTDNYNNSIKVEDSVAFKDEFFWLFIDNKTYEGDKMKIVSAAARLNVNQARVLVASLQDMIETMEKS